MPGPGSASAVLGTTSEPAVAFESVLAPIVTSDFASSSAWDPDLATVLVHAPTMTVSSTTAPVSAVPLALILLRLLGMTTLGPNQVFSGVGQAGRMRKPPAWTKELDSGTSLLSKCDDISASGCYHLSATR